MPAQSHATVWSAYISDTSDEIAIGTVMIPDADGEFYIPATSGNRTAASRTTACSGIAITEGDSTSRVVELQTVGPCPPSITGLGAGAAGPIIVSSTGTLERKPAPIGSDIVVGRCDADGWAYLNFSPSQSASGLSWPLQADSDADDYLWYGADGDTLPDPGSMYGGLIRLGSTVGTGGLPWGVVNWYDPASSSHYSLMSVQSNGSGAHSVFTLGAYYGDVGQYINTVIYGDDITLIGNDGGGSFFIAGQDSFGATRAGQHVSYRLAIGSSGTSATPAFSSTNNAAGPMLLLTECVAEPTGNPTGATRDGVWIWLSANSTNGLKIKFPSGNIVVIPDTNGTVTVA